MKSAPARPARRDHTSPPADTAEKLVAAAERLFAQHGYARVSVRAIALAAGVNWSLVGYHFRGKEGLLAEVYRRHCTILNAERLKLLAAAGSGPARLEAVIDAFVRPALTGIQSTGGGAFSRLRAILAAEDSDLLEQLVTENFNVSSRTFVAELQTCLPHLPADEVLWRFHFMLGSIYYSASSPQRIKDFSDGRCDPGDLEANIRHLVPFLAAGFRGKAAGPAAARPKAPRKARRR